MSRTVAYVRVSTDKQDLENQRREIERYCASNGLVVDTWDEDIASGTIQLKDRKAGALIDSLETGDHLLVSEISRISRRMRTIVNVLFDCIENGIEVTSIKEGFTFRDDIQSKVMMGNMAVMADWERTLISQRTKEGLARKRAEGVRLGRPPGSHKPENRKLHGQDEAILRYMRKRVPLTVIARLLDVSVSTLRRYVNDEDLQTRHLFEQFKQTGDNKKRTRYGSEEVR